MTERRTDTITIGKDTEYAKVVTRVKAFIEDNADRNVSITTTYEWKDGWVIFQSVVECPRGKFTGHSLGKIDNKQKAFEKQETIAVGRALAFAGYLASGEIASFEEMQEFSRTVSSDISQQQFNQLKRDWWNVYGGDFEKDEAAEHFLQWVVQETEMELHVAANWSDWTPADLAKCRKSLESQTEAALTSGGL